MFSSSASSSKPVALQVYPEYGYVLLVLVPAFLLHVYQMLQVGKMRKLLKVRGFWEGGRGLVMHLIRPL